MLRVRWLGRVPYAQAHSIQRAMFHRDGDHLLLLEHDHVFTMGVRADPAHILVDPASVGAAVARAERGGDVTYHGPGQVVGYPILSVPPSRGSTPAYVASVEQVVIDALESLGLPGAGRLAGFPGVWVGLEENKPRKIAAVGIRMSRGRTMHGFALNVDPDMAYFGYIVPCGISEYPVTSLAAEGFSGGMKEVVDALAASAARIWGDLGWERQDVQWQSPKRAGSELRRGIEARMERAGVAASQRVELSARKPAWLRAPARMGEDYRALRRTMRSLDLVTVCEEAGCPNIYECWAAGTATFMINGQACTRACAFCLVDTSRPGPLDPAEPSRVAQAVAKMGLGHAVVTAVARDDLADGGAKAFAATIEAIRSRCPGTAIEVLVPDFKGSEEAEREVLLARPEVFNHNLETVARLQRLVRPSASYARSLAVLARAGSAGLVTKSGLMTGLGESREELVGAMADLRAVGVGILTLGQYVRPSPRHLPVDRWYGPEEFEELAAIGAEMGFAHVEAGPLVRSSYHAASSARAVAGAAAAG